LSNYRETWAFTGFVVAGISAGDLTAVYDHNGGAVHGTVRNTAGQSLDAYLINNRIYQPNPAGGYVDLDPTNPLAAPAQSFFALPGTILTTITPSNASYQATGTTTVNEQAATQYNGTVEIGNLGFISPALQGQSGTAVVTLAISSDQGLPVMATITFRTAGAAGQNVATARLDLSNIDQVGPITAPR